MPGLYSYDEVTTNGLTDKVPVLQSNANKVTTLQKIRDLFANYFAVAESVATALGLKANTSDVNAALALKVDKVAGKGLIGAYAEGNTDTNTSEVTINATGGIAVFTISIGAGSVRPLVIINSNFAEGQKINPELVYDYDNNPGEPVILGYRVESGSAVIYVKNIHESEAASENKVIKFQIS